MEWNIKSDLPIYSQLIEQIKHGIVSGSFAPGERLQSVRDMAMEAGVNPNTMQRALQELEREGMVFSQRTSGRFVTEDSAAIDDARMKLARDYVANFLKTMSVLGFSKEQILGLLTSDTLEGKEDGNT